MKESEGYGGGTIISRPLLSQIMCIETGVNQKNPSVKVFNIPGEFRSATFGIEGLTVRVNATLLGAVWLTSSDERLLYMNSISVYHF